MITKTDINYREMGRRIRERRVEMQLTQEELAERAETSTSFIGHIERMEKAPSIDTMVRICRVLNLSLDYVVMGKKALPGQDVGLYDELRALVERYAPE